MWVRYVIDIFCSCLFIFLFFSTVVGKLIDFTQKVIVCNCTPNERCHIRNNNTENKFCRHNLSHIKYGLIH